MIQQRGVDSPNKDTAFSTIYRLEYNDSNYIYDDMKLPKHRERSITSRSRDAVARCRKSQNTYMHGIHDMHDHTATSVENALHLTYAGPFTLLPPPRRARGPLTQRNPAQPLGNLKTKDAVARVNMIKVGTVSIPGQVCLATTRESVLVGAHVCCLLRDTW